MTSSADMLYWIAAGACLAAGIGGIAAQAKGWGASRRYGPWAVPATATALLVVVVWARRWAASGHLPLFGTYESALSLAVAVVVVSWLWEARGAFRSISGPAASLVAGALLTHGYFFDDTTYALTISERSWVVDVHAVVAWGAFGLLTTNAALSLRAVVSREAPSARLVRAIERTLELGFVVHTAMMISGSIYKFMLFGSAWSFDPIETMGFVAWICYGTLIHMVRFAHWRGKRLAAWCLFLFVILVVSYRFIVYYPSWTTYHIFDVDLRMHLV